MCSRVARPWQEKVSTIKAMFRHRRFGLAVVDPDVADVDVALRCRRGALRSQKRRPQLHSDPGIKEPTVQPINELVTEEPRPVLDSCGDRLLAYR
jgi:hypothetical protein